MSKNDKVLIVFLLLVLGAFAVILKTTANDIAADIATREEQKLQEMDNLITTVSFGEHFLAHCHGEVYFILPYEAHAQGQKVAVLQGSGREAGKKIIELSDSPVEYILGCFKVRFIADPTNIYILEIYG